MSAFARLEKRLGYVFTQSELLKKSLTHRSFGPMHNERLEFLGDGVLNCIIANLLYRQFPLLPEGDLSRMRSHLVKESTLNDIAQEFSLGEVILLGEGELKSGGRQRPSLLADAVEALIGAIFLDGGFAAAEKVVPVLFHQRLQGLDPERLGKDPKTLLQERLQAKKRSLPIYNVLEITGEAHRQLFRVECRVAELGVVTTGEAGSRRAAEQLAAEAACEVIE